VPYKPFLTTSAAFSPRGMYEMSNTEPQTETAHLKRVLGRWDLVLLFVVAIVNLNVVPSISASGGMTVWLGNSNVNISWNPRLELLNACSLSCKRPTEI